MDFDMRGFGQGISLYWPEVGAALCLTAAAWAQMLRTRRLTQDRARERSLRGELEAYARLDTRVGANGDMQRDMQDLGRRVSRTVAEVSAFAKVALLTKDAEGRLFVVGSSGINDVTLAALSAWGERAKGPRLSERLGEARDGSAGGAELRLGVRDPGKVKPWTRSFVLELRQEPVMKLAKLAKQEKLAKQDKLAGGMDGECPEVWVAPLWTTAGRMIGAVVVEGSLQRGCVEEALSPVEMLAAKLARSLENAALAERLLRSERLAGLGQLAGGVAHALNNPLAAVMGYAELIAESSDEPRVQEDAAKILREALRMRESVQSLVDLWQPAMTVEEDVDLVRLVEELASQCKDKLEARGVLLVIEVGKEAMVLGSKCRLQQVLEHLLNNAAQAVALAPAAGGERHVIRVTVRQEERGAQMIVSDSGPGFAEPARAFDPFYTGLWPGQGAGLGLGLSVCYGIVHEHGGEISAFNLHPGGAAVVIELPSSRREAREYAMEQQT